MHTPSFLVVFRAIFSLACYYCMLTISFTGFIYSFATYRLASNALQTSARCKLEQPLFRCTSREFWTDNCLLEKCTLRKKCPHSELSWSIFFPHFPYLDLIRRETDTFYVVVVSDYWEFLSVFGLTTSAEHNILSSQALHVHLFSLNSSLLLQN